MAFPLTLLRMLSLPPSCLGIRTNQGNRLRVWAVSPEHGSHWHWVSLPMFTGGTCGGTLEVPGSFIFHSYSVYHVPLW